MKISNQDMARLCRSMAFLLHGGISLAEGLFLLAREEETALRTVLEQAGTEMDGGCGLCEALEETGLLPGHALGLLRIAEETGRTEEALHALAAHFGEIHRTEGKLREALLWPAMTFVLMLLVVGVLLIQVLPVFDQVYASLGSRLTGAAAALLYLGQLLKQTMPVWLFLLAAVAAAGAALRLVPGLREKTDHFLRSRFGDRGIAAKFNNARFAQALSMGLRSGMSPERGAELAALMLKDSPGAARRCEVCIRILESEGSLEEAAGESGLIPPARCRMLGLALRTGNAEEALEEIARGMTEDAWKELDDKAGRIEPALVLVSSLLVGLILLAVMLPLTDILSVLG